MRKGDLNNIQNTFPSSTSVKLNPIQTEIDAREAIRLHVQANAIRAKHFPVSRGNMGSYDEFVKAAAGNVPNLARRTAADAVEAQRVAASANASSRPAEYYHRFRDMMPQLRNAATIVAISVIITLILIVIVAVWVLQAFH